MSSSSNNSEKINVALAEYHIMHEKVFANGKRLEAQVIQIYVIIAAVFGFSIYFYNTPDLKALELLVDLAMIFLLPTLALAAIITTLTLELRTVFHGQYIATIEKRLNVLLGHEVGVNSQSENNDAYGRTVDYERYRLLWGHRKHRFSTNADYIVYALLLTFITFSGSIYRIIERECTLYKFFQPVWIVLLSVVTLRLILIFNKENEKLQKIVRDKQIVYEPHTAGKKER